MTPRLGLHGLLLCVAVMAVAAGARAGYLFYCVDQAAGPTPLFVQDKPDRLTAAAGPEARALLGYPNVLDQLIYNVKDSRRFAAVAPLAAEEEMTAHVAPGYPGLVGLLYSVIDDASTLLKVIRWTQCG